MHSVCITSKLLSFSNNSSSCSHILNGLQPNPQNIFLKVTPTPSGSDHRKFVDTFGRPLYSDWKKHVSKVLNPFKGPKKLCLLELDVLAFYDYLLMIY